MDQQHKEQSKGSDKKRIKLDYGTYFGFFDMQRYSVHFASLINNYRSATHQRLSWGTIDNAVLCSMVTDIKVLMLEWGSWYAENEYAQINNKLKMIELVLEKHFNSTISIPPSEAKEIHILCEELIHELIKKKSAIDLSLKVRKILSTNQKMTNTLVP